MDPKPGPKLIGHHPTDPMRWRARSAAETVTGQIFSVEYDGIEYDGFTGIPVFKVCLGTPSW